MNRRNLILAASVCAAPAIAQTRSGIFAVNEAVSYKSSGEDSMPRWQLLAKDLGKMMGTHLSVVKVSSYDLLAVGLHSGAYDVAFVHPAHHAIRAINNSGYQFAGCSKAHTQYKASFLIRANSAYGDLKALAGRTIYTPSEDSITAWLARACIQDAFAKLPTKPRVVALRYQDAIRFAVENKLGEAGCTASEAEVNIWKQAGNKVLMQSPSIPIRQVLIHGRFKSVLGDVSAFLHQQSDLQMLGLPQGLVGYDLGELLKKGQWLERGGV